MTLWDFIVEHPVLTVILIFLFFIGLESLILAWRKGGE